MIVDFGVKIIEVSFRSWKKKRCRPRNLYHKIHFKKKKKANTKKKKWTKAKRQTTKPRRIYCQQTCIQEIISDGSTDLQEQMETIQKDKELSYSSSLLNTKAFNEGFYFFQRFSITPKHGKYYWNITWNFNSSFYKI